MNDDPSLLGTYDADAGETTVPSLFEQLAGERDDAVATDHVLKLPVPGYKTLWVGFKYVPPEQIEQDPKKYKGLEPKIAGPLAAADTLAMLCEQLYVGESEGALVPLHEAAGIEVPIRFDDVAREHICKLPPAGNSRQTVFDVYTNGKYGIIEHARRVTAWLKDTTQTAQDGLLGG